MPTIFFKKQQLGKWRRDDGEAKKHVNEESMFREIEQLVHDGWKVKTHGVTHARAIEVTKPEPKPTEILFCEQCDTPKSNTQTETVPNRGPGWKCIKCRWWNWIKFEEDDLS